MTINCLWKTRKLENGISPCFHSRIMPYLFASKLTISFGTDVCFSWSYYRDLLFEISIIVNDSNWSTLLFM